MHHGSFARGARRWPAGSLALVLALLGAPAAFGAHHITADRSAGRQGREIRDLRHDQATKTNRGRPAGWSAGAVCLGSGYRRAGGSRRVRRLQRWLRARGYRPGRVDGRFGPRTRAALLAFQAERGLRRSGAVDAGTLTALRSRPTRPHRGAVAPPAAALTGTDAAASPAGWSAGAVCLGSGYRRSGGSRRVRQLQRWLRARGYRPGRVDGRFGPRTRAALLSFQIRHDLRRSGAADAGTLTALRSRPARPQRAASRLPDPVATSIVTAAPPPRSAATGTPSTALVVIALLLLGGVIVIVAWAASARREKARPTPQPPPATPATGPARADAATPASKPRRAQPETDLASDPGPAEPGPTQPEAARDAANPTPDGSPRQASGLWCRPPASLTGEPQPAGPGLPAPRLGRVQATPPADPPPWPDAVPPQRTGPAVDARPGRVLGYVTVPHGQPREAALDPATETIAEWCEQHGRELIRVIHDVDFGAARSTDRPGLDYVLDQIAEGAVAGLVLLRTRDLADSLPQLATRLRHLIAADAFLISLDDRIDTSTAAGRLAAHALTQVGDWERAGASERSRRAPTPARAAGAGGGRAAVRDDPDLSARIQAMRACGMTLQAIADTLNHEQVPTVRGGTHWRPSSVQAAIGYKRPTGRPPGIERPRIRRDPGSEPQERRA